MAEFDSTVEYRDIQGFPGYRIGSDGTVWTCRGKISLGIGFGTQAILTTQWKRKSVFRNGQYFRVALYKDGRSHPQTLHVLLLTAFKRSPLPG
jgi:hypothetical protein